MRLRTLGLGWSNHGVSFCREKPATGIPIKGKSMYIVEIWPTGVAGGRAVPPNVLELTRFFSV